MNFFNVRVHLSDKNSDLYRSRKNLFKILWNITIQLLPTVYIYIYYAFYHFILSSSSCQKWIVFLRIILITSVLSCSQVSRICMFGKTKLKFKLEKVSENWNFTSLLLFKYSVFYRYSFDKKITIYNIDHLKYWL